MIKAICFLLAILYVIKYLILTATCRHRIFKQKNSTSIEKCKDNQSAINNKKVNYNY